MVRRPSRGRAAAAALEAPPVLADKIRVLRPCLLLTGCLALAVVPAWAQPVPAAAARPAAAPAAARAASVLDDARAAARAGRRDEAMSLLEGRLTAAPRDVDARLLYGLVLSWDGRYPEATRELELVLQQAPSYADAHVALANVAWWSHDYARLSALADLGLKRTPDSPFWALHRARALEGLGRHREAAAALDRLLARTPGDSGARALRERIDASLHPWTAGVRVLTDSFSDGRDRWLETSASIARRTPVGSIILRGSRADRFARTDSLVEVEAYPRFRPGTYAYVAFGAGTDTTLYPETRVGVDLHQAVGRGFELSGGWRRLDFADVTNIYVGSLTKYTGPWMLVGRVYHVPGPLGIDDSTTWQGQARRYFGRGGTSFAGAGYSRGLAREEIRNSADFLTLGSDTVRGELDTAIGRRLRLNVWGGTSRQERFSAAVWQHTVGVGVDVSF
jgi:YaiO family outer membrane protein